jgi:DNA-binding SARP family transcriptional activator
LYFSILGSLEVRTSGARVLISAPKQRAVLVTLLLDANNEVPIDRLTRFVWDGHPPVAAQTTLQSYIYRLRLLLRPVAGVELNTRSASYMLQVDPAETDLWSFRQRVAEAREQALGGDPRHAALRLREAVAMWRGSALTGVPGKLLQQEALFLEDERTAAYEDLFSLELALGDHRRIVPELKKLVSSHHMHETLRAQLMLALYRSGRQAEALQVYGHFRRRLREDLGIEPGLELQELHRAILMQAPSTTISLPSPLAG